MAAKPKSTTSPTEQSRHVVEVPTSELVHYARNARTHSDLQISKIIGSMVEFGFTNPVLRDSRGIIAGHGRVLAAERAYAEGLTLRYPDGAPITPGHVPTLNCDGWSEEQRRAYILADNRLALDAGWDEDLLASELAALDQAGYDLALTGFDEGEIDALLALDDDEPLPDADPDEAPEPQGDPVARRGDVWLLGRHRVMCGDSCSVDDMATLMDGKLALLVVTDPPYNLAYEGGTKDKLTILNDKMDGESLYRFLYDAYVAMFTAADDGCAIYVFHADSEGANFRRALVEAGWKLAQCCVWVKDRFVLGRQDYHWQHEPVLFGVKHDPVLYGWKPTGGHRWFGDRKQTTVWEFARPQRNAEHPTMKPVELIEYPITNSSQRGEIVLDPFGGSGSTLIACERTKRQARLMELDPRYVDVIIRRWQDFTGKAATLAATGETFAQLEAKRVPMPHANDNAAPPSKDRARTTGLMLAGKPFTQSPAANDDRLADRVA